MVVTIINIALFCFFAWTYSLTLSSSLTVTDYTDEVLRQVESETETRMNDISGGLNIPGLY